MKKVLVLYYSRTGNTEKMAKAVAEGVQSNGKVEAELHYYMDAKSLGTYDAILVGAPTYNHTLPIDFQRLLEEVAILEISLKGKIGAVFGSYGWSGEAPRLILEILKNKFEMQVIEPPLLAKYTPDQNTLNACKQLGIRVSEMLMNQA